MNILLKFRFVHKHFNSVAAQMTAVGVKHV